MDAIAKALPEELQKIFTEHASEIELKSYEIKLDYASLDYYQVVRQLLPDTVEVPQPLEKVGHIVCFYLTTAQYLYRTLIAQVYIDKYPDIKTVVNRGFNPETNSILTEFVLGDPTTTVKITEENHAELMLDYAKSGYTTRMEEEYKRILHYVNMNYTVCDLLADCGAVTIRAAKKGCRVISNCASPETFIHLSKNVEANLVPGVRTEKVKTYNMKTGDFINSVFGPVADLPADDASKALATIPEDFKRVNVIYINDFFNAFGYIKQILTAIRAQCENLLNNIWSVRNLPKIYFYYSLPEKSTKAAVIAKLKEVFAEAGCGTDTFDEKCVIGIKANRYVYPDVCLHCVYMRIPAAAVFSKDYMDMYGSQELSIPNPGSICSLSIGDTLELLDEMKIPKPATEARAVAAGKRSVPEAAAAADPTKNGSEKKKKPDEDEDHP